MITEPELTGGSEEPGRDVIADPGSRPRPAVGGWRNRRLWAWGLGGAVAASAAWAGGLHAYDLRHDGRPALHGYVLTGSPCAGSALTPLTRALKASTSASVSPALVRLGPALDQMRCTVSATVPVPQGGTSQYEVFATVDLHKRTDPRPEFDDQHTLDSADLTPAEKTVRVPGLGDEAYLLTIREQTQELKVLHGGAVFTLTLTGYNTYDVSDDTVNALHGAHLPSADMSRFESVLVQAMRGVMAGQRPHGAGRPGGASG